MEANLTERIRLQRQAFLRGDTRPEKHRRDTLRRLRDLLIRNEGRLMSALSEDLGKPPLEGYFSDIGSVIGDIDHALKHLTTWMRPRRTRTPLLLFPGRSYIVPEPYGVALVLAPWNYPVSLLLRPAVGAIAAGNTVVLKPSELVPATERTLAELIGSEFDPSHLAVVTGGPETSSKVLDEKFDLIFFTGSTRVGREVMKKAAVNLTPVILELGGKSPVLVDRGTDLTVTARRIVWGKFFNSGQTCIAPDYVLVHESEEDRFVEEARNAVSRFFGESAKASGDLARVVTVEHWERLSTLLRRTSGKIALGGSGDRESRRLAPTLVRDVAFDDPLMEEEIFGPVLPILTYRSWNEAIQRVRERPKPLALYVFSNDSTATGRALEAIPSGGACVNDTLYHYLSPDLPFGGVGESGMGRYHRAHTFEAFSHFRGVLKRSLSLDFPLRYPPYRIPLERMKRIFSWVSG